MHTKHLSISGTSEWYLYSFQTFLSSNRSSSQPGATTSARFHLQWHSFQKELGNSYNCKILLGFMTLTANNHILSQTDTGVRMLKLNTVQLQKMPLSKS